MTNLSSLPFTPRPTHVGGLFALLLLLSACNDAATPPPQSMPTLAPTREPLVVDLELLQAPFVSAACDAAADAAFTCPDPTQPALEVNTTAASYARWRLAWDGSPLQGNEVLTLRLTHRGNLNPNLYLVDGSGERRYIRLAQFGLPEGTHDFHVPLREVRGGGDTSLDWTAIQALELVFEWADMAGSVTVESAQLLSIWREPVVIGNDAVALAAGLTLPDGFRAHVLADGLREQTQIMFTPTGDMLVSLQSGRIWWYSDANGDGGLDHRHLYATGFEEVVGLLYDPDRGDVWVGGRGALYHTRDVDGNGSADERTPRLEGLPWGRHQNNGLTWGPIPDPFTGESDRHFIYFGLGSTEDLIVGGEYNAAVLRFPRDGQGMADLEIVSRGNRNPYDVLWANLPQDLNDPAGPRSWQLFAGENGPDFNDAPDEVNHIRRGKHYGFPDQFGPVASIEEEDAPYSGPVYPVTPHASANGLAYVDHPAWPLPYCTLYVALFGEVFNPTPVGHIVEQIVLQPVTLPNGDVTYRGEPRPFVVGMDRPLPLTTAPDGQLVAGDYATGVIYHIVYAGDGATGDGATGDGATGDGVAESSTEE